MVTPASARSTASSRWPTTRSRWLTAGPVTRNDTGAWSIRGERSSPASPSRAACTRTEQVVAAGQRRVVRVARRPHESDLGREDGQRLGSRQPGVPGEQHRAGGRHRDALEERDALLRPERVRRDARSCQGLRGRHQGATPVERVAGPGEEPAEVREGDDLAGGAVSRRGEGRVQVGGQHGDEVLRERRGGPRLRVEQGAQPGREHRTRRAPVEPGGAADGAGQHQVALVVGLVGRADGEVGLQPHPGRHAVDRAGVGQRRQGERAGVLEPLQQRRVEREVRAVGHGDDRRRAQVGRVGDEDGRHR